MHISIDRTVHTTAFDKPVVDHWLERKIAQTAAGSTEKDRSDDQPLQRRARYRLSYRQQGIRRAKLDVRLARVPAHVGIIGNQTIDYFAKQIPRKQ